MTKHTREFYIRILRDTADRKRRNDNPTLTSGELEGIAKILEDDGKNGERLMKAIGFQMEEKHKESAEARVWFYKAQEAKAEYIKLRTALERISKPERFYLSEQFKWAQDIALAALGLSEGVVYEVNHKEQELSVIIVKLQEALVTIASHGCQLTREDCERIAKEALGLP